MKKKYIRPATEMVCIANPKLLSGSSHEINDKPYADGKQNRDDDWGQTWDEAEGDMWHNSHSSGLPKSKNLWED